MAKQVPKGWEKTKIGLLLNLEYGKALPESARHEGVAAVFGSNGRVGSHDVGLVSGPGIIIGRKGSAGSVHWSNVDFWPIDTTYFVQPTSPVNLKWVFYKLSHIRLSDLVDKSGVPGLNRDNVASLSCLLPPLPEQEKIAEILGSVDAAVTATRRVIEQTRTVRRSLMQKLLTKGIPGRHTSFKESPLGFIPRDWKLRTLGELSALITSGSRGWARYFADSGSLFLRSQNIRSGRLDLRDRQFVNVPSGAEGDRTLVTLNDLLFTITGNSVGNVAWVSESLGQAYVSQHIALVRLSDPQLAELAAVFFSPDGPGNAQVLRAQYGQSKPGLNLKNLRDLMIPIPPVSEAKKITEMVLQFSMLSHQSEKELRSLITVRAALLSSLLSGKILVSIPDSDAVKEVVHG
jgi:type I restriction enzyme, S subunit